MPATSEASREALYAVPETSYGVLPLTPQFARKRKTSVKINLSKETFQSEEADPKRQIRDFRHGNKQTGGEFGWELSYGSFDQELEAVLFSEDWGPRISIESDAVSVLASDDSYNGTGFPILDVGEKITVTGFTTGGNNGLKTVLTSTATKITVSEALTDEAAGDDVTLVSTGIAIKAGVKRRSFSLLRHFEDQIAADEPFHLYKGFMWNGFNLQVTVGGSIKGTFTGIGRELSFHQELNDADPEIGVAAAGAVLGNPTASRMFDSFTGWLKEGGVNIGTVTEINITLDNGLEPLFVLFDDKTLEPPSKRSNVTGSITVLFKSSVMMKKFVNEQNSSLEFRIVDKAGNAYQFKIPNISYSGAPVDTETEGPISLSMPFQAIYSELVDSNIQIVRYPIA